MPKITVKHNENFESALRRFKKTCDRSKVLQDYKDKQFHQKPSENRKMAKLEAIKNTKKELRKKEAFFNKNKR